MCPGAHGPRPGNATRPEAKRPHQALAASAVAAMADRGPGGGLLPPGALHAAQGGPEVPPGLHLRAPCAALPGRHPGGDAPGRAVVAGGERTHDRGDGAALAAAVSAPGPTLRAGCPGSGRPGAAGLRRAGGAVVWAGGGGVTAPGHPQRRRPAAIRRRCPGGGPGVAPPAWPRGAGVRGRVRGLHARLAPAGHGAGGDAGARSGPHAPAALWPWSRLARRPGPRQSAGCYRACSRSWRRCRRAAAGCLLCLRRCLGAGDQRVCVAAEGVRRAGRRRGDGGARPA